MSHVIIAVQVIIWNILMFICMLYLYIRTHVDRYLDTHNIIYVCIHMYDMVYKFIVHLQMQKFIIVVQLMVDGVIGNVGHVPKHVVVERLAWLENVSTLNHHVEAMSVSVLVFFLSRHLAMTFAVLVR